MGLPPEEHRPLRSGIEINSATPIDSATASYIDTGTLTGLAHDQNGQQVLVTCRSTRT